MLLRFVFLALIDALANLIGYCLNPALPAFADAQGNLPTWLRWFQTHDATLDGRGNQGGIETRFLRATAWLREPDGAPRNALCRYLCRVAWLYRNNAYGFAVSVLGARGRFIPLGYAADLYAPIVSEVPGNRFPAQAGWRLEFYRGGDGRTYFHFWYVRDRGNGKCHEANIGWKIAPETARAQLVWRYTPWRAFEAKSVA